MGLRHRVLPHGHRKRKTPNAQFTTTILYKASMTVLTKFSHISLATEQIFKYKLTSKNNTHTKKYTLYSKQWPRCHFYCLEVPKQRSTSLFFYSRLHHRSSHNVMLYPWSSATWLFISVITRSGMLIQPFANYLCCSFSSQLSPYASIILVDIWLTEFNCGASEILSFHPRNANNYKDDDYNNN